jgi:WD40 repeat protein
VTGRPVRRLDGHQDRVTDVAFDPHGGRLATADMHAVRLWATRSGRLLRTFPGHPGSRTTVAFDPSGGRLAGTGSTAHAVHIWDTRTGRETAAIDFAGSTPQSMAFSLDGRLLALGGGDCSLRLVDASTGVEAAWFAGRRMIAVRRVFYTPDGGGLVAVPSRGGALRRWRIRPAQAEPGASIPVSDGETRSLRHSRAVCGVAFSPDGERLATNDGDVRIWRLDTGRETAVSGPADLLAKVVWSPDDTAFGYARGLTGVVLADPGSGHEIRAWDFKGLGVSGLAFDAKGSRLAAALGDQSVVIWNPATGKVLTRLTAPATVVHSGVSTMAFSPDGALLASGAVNGTADVHLWRLGEAPRLQRLHGHTASVTTVAFDPSGERLATAGEDRTVLLWDTATGDEIAELTEHRRAVRAIAFSADGRWLASADEAGDVLLRDAANGTPLLRLAPHNGMVLSLAFHPRSDALATAGADGEVRIHTRWSAAPT